MPVPRVNLLGPRLQAGARDRRRHPWRLLSGATALVLGAAACSGGGSSAVRVAQAASDDLVRLGVSTTDDLTLTADDLARIAAATPKAQAQTDDLARAASQADESTTWGTIRRGLGDVATDEQLVAEVQEAVRKGAVETACNATLYGTPPTFEGFSANVIKNGPTPPQQELQQAWQATLALNDELQAAYASGEDGRATVLVFCFVAAA